MNKLTHKYVVGLAGGIGSGKSTIAKLFANLGIDYIDADDVARRIVEPNTPCLKAIADHYGPDILFDNGQLNRRKLREIIFNNKAEKNWLESLTHPVVHQEILKELKASTSTYVLLVHPLLFEKQKNDICDYTLAISVPKEMQIERVCQRDNIEKDLALSIIQSQLSNEERSQQADEVIENNGDIAKLNDKIIALHKKLSALANVKLNQ